jgi:hypothetical protein
MKKYIADLKSISPLSFSKHHTTEFLEKEGRDAYEDRTWRGRIHADENGNVIIPPMMFKNCLSAAAKFLGMGIPGKGKSTYTKHVEAGVMCVQPITLPMLVTDVPSERLFVPSDGIRGSGKRVWRNFPFIQSWAGPLEIIVTDETVTAKVLQYHLEQAGSLVGIGRFRPRNNGYYGRFTVRSMKEV